MKWFRRFISTVAVWLFAFQYGKTVAESFKNSIHLDDRYKLDCSWVPRDVPFADISKDPLTKAFHDFYLISAIGLIVIVWNSWETLSPKETRAAGVTVEAKEHLPTESDTRSSHTTGGALTP